MRPGEGVANEAARRVRVVVSECVDHAEREAGERLEAAQREAAEIVAQARTEASVIREQAEAAARLRAEQAEAEATRQVEEVRGRLQELGQSLATVSSQGAADQGLAALARPRHAEPRRSRRSNGNGHASNGNGHASNGNGHVSNGNDQPRSLRSRFRRIVGDDEELSPADDDWIIAKLTAANMIANGTSREAVERHLRRHFDLANVASLVEDVVAEEGAPSQR